MNLLSGQVALEHQIRKYLLSSGDRFAREFCPLLQVEGDTGLVACDERNQAGLGIAVVTKSRVEIVGGRWRDVERRLVVN